MNITILNERTEKNIQCHAMLNAHNAQHNTIESESRKATGNRLLHNISQTIVVMVVFCF